MALTTAVSAAVFFIAGLRRRSWAIALLCSTAAYALCFPAFWLTSPALGTGQTGNDRLLGAVALAAGLLLAVLGAAYRTSPTKNMRALFGILSVVLGVVSCGAGAAALLLAGSGSPLPPEPGGWPQSVTQTAALAYALFFTAVATRLFSTRQVPWRLACSAAAAAVLVSAGLLWLWR